MTCSGSTVSCPERRLSTEVHVAGARATVLVAPQPHLSRPLPQNCWRHWRLRRQQRTLRGSTPLDPRSALTGAKVGRQGSSAARRRRPLRNLKHWDPHLLPVSLGGAFASAMMRGGASRKTRGRHAKGRPLLRCGQDSRRPSRAPACSMAPAVDP